MNKQLFKNGAKTTLGAAFLSAATVATLADGGGTKFPALANGDYMLITLKEMPADGPNAPETEVYETIKVAAVVGDSATSIERGIEGTVRDWPAGSKFELRATETFYNRDPATPATPTTTLTGVVTGSGEGAVDTMFNVPSLDAAVSSLGYSKSAGATDSSIFTILQPLSVLTSATPTDGSGVAPAAYPCNAIHVQNDTAWAVEYQRKVNGVFSGFWYPTPPQSRFAVYGIVDASDIQFRLRSYATARVTQRVPLEVEAVHYANTYSVTHFRGAPSTNSGYNDMDSFPCNAVYVHNCGLTDFYVKMFDKFQIFGTINGTWLHMISRAAGREAIGQVNANGAAPGTKIIGYADSSGNPATVDNGSDYIVSISQTIPSSTFMEFDGGVSHRVARGKSKLFTGLINADQLGTSTLGGNIGEFAALRFVGAVPPLHEDWFVIAEGISSDAKEFFRESTSDTPEVFLMRGDAAPKTDFNRQGSRIALFRDVAGTTLSGPATMADAAFSGDIVSMVNLGPTQMQVTLTGTGQVRAMSTIYPLSPVDMSECDVHFRAQLVSGTMGTLMIDVYSDAPGTMGANFHRFDAGSLLSLNDPLTTGQVSALTHPYGYSARSLSKMHGVAQGTGADLTKITYAVMTFSGATGTIINLQYIDLVKRSDKATLIFSIDDQKAGAMTGMMPLLAAANCVGMMYMSPENVIAATPNTGSLSIESILSLQANGWQAATQDYSGAPNSADANTFFDNPGWLVEMKKNVGHGLALGLNPEGLRDGSLYGGGSGPGANNGNPYYKHFRKVMATSRRYDVLGKNTVGGAFTGYLIGNTVTLTSDNPGTGVVPGSIMVGYSSTGISDDIVISGLASGVANKAGAVYNFTGTAQTIGSAGAPVALAVENQLMYACCDTNPPGDPWDLKAMGWDASFPQTNSLSIYACMRIYLDQAILAHGLCILPTHNGYDGALSSIQNLAIAEFLRYYLRKKALGLVRNLTLMDTRLQQAARARA